MLSNDQLASIEAVIFDCDGVLTPGDLYYDQKGPSGLRFHARDGFGIAMFCKKAGLKAGIISGRPIAIAQARFAELGISKFVGQSKNKYEDTIQFCHEFNLNPENVAFVGDDIPDLSGFKAVGHSVAVANACAEVLEHAEWILKTNGGYGAAREVCESILKAKGVWQKLIAS